MSDVFGILFAQSFIIFMQWAGFLLLVYKSNVADRLLYFDLRGDLTVSVERF